MERILDKRELEELCPDGLGDTESMILRQAGMLEDVPAEVCIRAVERTIFPSGHQSFVTVIGLE